MSKVKSTSTSYENKQLLNESCTEIYAVNLIGGQWTLAICCYLMNGPLRFGELRKCLPGITERMLTLQLRKMEKNRLVKRTVFAEVPPRVEYELTESGYGLTPIIGKLDAWGSAHKKMMEQAPEAYP